MDVVSHNAHTEILPRRRRPVLFAIAPTTMKRRHYGDGTLCATSRMREVSYVCSSGSYPCDFVDHSPALPLVGCEVNMRRIAQWPIVPIVPLVLALAFCGLTACNREQGVEAA